MIELQGEPTGEGRRFAIVAGRFNQPVTDLLLAGAVECLLEHGVAEADIIVAHVPGAWELPVAAQRLAARRDVDAVIAIGCVIRGGTPHFEYVAAGAADGLASVALDGRLPVLLGVLTTDSEEQAFARAGGPNGNKGRDAALAALEMVDLLDRLEEGENADAGA